MQLRQITSCTAPAVWTLPRRSSNKKLVWQLYMCDRHRSLGPRLSGAIHQNTRAYQRVEGAAPRCGTLHDHQPIAQALTSHTRMWLAAAEPDDNSEPYWLGELRSGAEHEAMAGGREADLLAEAVKVAERAPNDRETQEQVLALLAQAEAACVERLGR
ncbi:hypothetical protein Sipo8835_00095 [Streptomyces ipomoeae]|uniref:Uncharacterized protein n=1 Tax=Streptomyces ipomoeae TaxID=103232 RepID=A0AAE9B3U1_9ACTN|nr:hypothetical protein [Streptomyces ipomoeae]TQE40246.1 hypothetical protein Sipo8835_00095 [Streptomyces ipomoeae]